MSQKYHEYNVEEVSLDEKDRRILEHLNEDARITLTEMSRKTGIPVDTIKYRLDRMREHDVFQYAVILNPNKLGMPVFNAVYFQLVNHTAEQNRRLVSYVEEHKHIAYAAKSVGEYDFVIGIIAQNLQQFDAVFNDFKTAFQDLVKDYAVLSIIEEYKYDQLIDLIK